MFDVKRTIPQSPLYRAEFEHDNCGIGACVNIKGRKSRATVENALKIVENLEHRAGKDAEGETGDGVGILTQMPHKFMRKVTKGLGFDIGGEREYGVGMFFFPQDELQRNHHKCIKLHMWSRQCTFRHKLTLACVLLPVRHLMFSMLPKAFCYSDHLNSFLP